MVWFLLVVGLEAVATQDAVADHSAAQGEGEEVQKNISMTAAAPSAPSRAILRLPGLSWSGA